MEEKMTMLSHHKTQIDLIKVMHKMDNFFDEMRIMSRTIGKDVGVEYAETYWQHLGGGFQKTPLMQDKLSEHLLTKQE
jgi:hypothetical protein